MRQSVKEAPKLAPEPPSLPKPVTPPAPPAVIPQKPQVQSPPSCCSVSRSAVRQRPFASPKTLHGCRCLRNLTWCQRPSERLPRPAGHRPRLRSPASPRGPTYGRQRPLPWRRSSLPPARLARQVITEAAPFSSVATCLACSTTIDVSGVRRLRQRHWQPHRRRHPQQPLLWQAWPLWGSSLLQQPQTVRTEAAPVPLPAPALHHHLTAPAQLVCML